MICNTCLPFWFTLPEDVRERVRRGSVVDAAEFEEIQGRIEREHDETFKRFVEHDKKQAHHRDSLDLFKELFQEEM